MIPVGRAYAIIKGRMPGDPEQMQKALEEIPEAERMERNRQDAMMQIKRKKPYRLGESVRTRNG